MQLPDSSPVKEHVTCCAPVLLEGDKELHSRSKAYLLTHLYWHCLYQLPGCRPGCLNQTMHSYCKWLWWLRTSGSFYSYPWHGWSRSQADTKLIRHCLKPSGHHTSLSLHVTVSFPGDGMLLFNAMAMDLGNAETTQARKCIYVHYTAKFLQKREHALLLNIQISTNIKDKLVFVLTSLWLDKRA